MEHNYKINLETLQKSWTQIFLLVHSIIGNIMHDERYLVDWSSTHLQTIQVFDYQQTCVGMMGVSTLTTVFSVPTIHA
jgi:hypothetical protein